MTQCQIREPLLRAEAVRGGPFPLHLKTGGRLAYKQVSEAARLPPFDSRPPAFH